MQNLTDKFKPERNYSFLKKWIAGSHVVAGIFPTIGPSLVEEEIQDRIPVAMLILACRSLLLEKFANWRSRYCP